MTGRVSGRYPPGNPLLYRIKSSKTNKGHIVHQYDENDKNTTHSNQQKYVLDSTKTNCMRDSKDNIPSAHNRLDIQRYPVMFHNLQSLDRARESRMKQDTEELLNEVGGMLSDFPLTEQVQAKVTGFKRRLDAATDYATIHALYTELDNLRTRLFDRALGRGTWSNPH